MPKWKTKAEVKMKKKKKKFSRKVDDIRLVLKMSTRVHPFRSYVLFKQFSGFLFSFLFIWPLLRTNAALYAKIHCLSTVLNVNYNN